MDQKEKEILAERTKIEDRMYELEQIPEKTEEQKQEYKELHKRLTEIFIRHSL